MVPPASTAAHATLASLVAQSDLEERLAGLPRYYTYKEVLQLAFFGDEDAFFAAWAAGALPAAIRRECLVSLPPRMLEVGLLRLQIQQTTRVAALLDALLDEIRRAPEVSSV